MKKIITTTLSLLLTSILWAQIPTYKWVSGSQDAREKSILNSTGPGPRNGHFTFTDSNGNLWLFGGTGQDFNVSAGFFDDVWKYDPNSNAWSWMSGKETVDVSNIEDNNSLKFDGIDDFIVMNTGYPIATVPFEMTDITIEFWIKTSEPGPIMSYANETLTPEWELQIEQFEGSDALVLFRAFEPIFYLEDLTITDDEWHHLAFVTKEGDDIFIEDLLFVYLDGQLIHEVNIESNNPFTAFAEDDPNNFSFLRLGARINNGFTDFFKGQMDELRFWNYARSESQIKTDRFRQINPFEEGVTGYYSFNQGIPDSPENDIDFLADLGQDGKVAGLVNFERDPYFEGEMAQIRLLSTSKNLEEIQALSQTPVDGLSTGVVNAYDFKEATADADNTAITNINDIASLNYDGELRNFTLEGSVSNYQSAFMSIIPRTYESSLGGNELALGDLNGDNYPDLITVNNDENSISVRLNDQAGDFTAKVDFGTDSQPRHLTTGFFNEDDNLDIAVSTTGNNSGESKVRLFFGDGLGGVSSIADFAMPDLSGPGKIASADLNDDTFEDIVLVLSQTAQITIIYGNGLGGSLATETFDLGSYYNFGLEVADFTNDGWLDIVVSTFDGFGNPNIGILRNNTLGSFEEMTTTDQWEGFLQVSEFKAADITGDGNLDLIYIDGFNYGTLVGRGDGTFTESFRGESLQYNYSGLEVLDLNDDNILDLIAVSNERNKIDLFHGNNQGEFNLATSSNIPFFAESVAIADLDQNGYIDIAISHYNKTSVYLRVNEDIQQFEPVNTLNFDGIDDFVNTPDYGIGFTDPNIFDNDFTWEAWVKTIDDGPLFSMTTDGFDNGWPSGDLQSFALVIEDNKLAVIQDGNIYNSSINSIEEYDITDGQWHHVAFSITSAYPSSVTFFLDGIQLSSDYSAPDGINQNELNFSAYNADEQGYAGRLGYVRPSFKSVFNSSLNQAFTSNWTTGFEIPTEKSGRAYGASWRGIDNSFYVFGGQGVDGLYNSIRQYNPTSNEWVTIKGLDVPYSASDYGTKSVSSPSNIPPSRWLVDGTTDLDQNFWVFGGAASEDPITRMSDLWKYDPLLNEWVWVSGPDSKDQLPVYGTKGIGSAENIPGSRENHKLWSDSENNIWLFGGFGLDSEGTLGHLNDLWKYSITANEWTWVSGSNLANQRGEFGELGVYSESNIPGGRAAYNVWVETNGIVWIFDGQGFDKFGIEFKYLNDLWSYNPETNEWAWQSGSDFASSTGSYIEQGVSSVDFVPGARWHSNVWNDTQNNLWMFGGNFPNQVTTGQYNDLWKFEPLTKEWTWVSGFNATATADQFGVYGDLNAGSQPTPGARNGALEWIDQEGNLWIQGGAYVGGSITEAFKPGYLNDLWKYSPERNAWTYFGGSTEIGVVEGEYGSRGIGSSMNVPKDRWHGASWMGQDGKLWFFGGIHTNNAISDIGWLNDLWNYDPESNVYTWMGGSPEINPSGVFGTKGEASVGHIPGPRSSAATWEDEEGNFYLFGGYESFQYNNDLWKLNPNTLEWTWLSGNSFQNTPGSYGTKGRADADNLIGARRYLNAEVDSQGNVWFFGGQGYDSEAQFGYLNDVWKYDPVSNEWTWMSGPNLINQAPNFGSQGVADEENSPPARYGYSSWMDDSDNLWVFGGVGVLGEEGSLFAAILNDLWKYDTKNNIWTWVDGANLDDVPNFGIQGEFDESNVIPRRQRSQAFGPFDKSIWLHGGRFGTSDSYNDLWEIKFTPEKPFVSSAQNVNQTTFTFQSDEAWTREYRVQIGETENFGNPFYDQKNSDASLTIENLLPGTRYYYRVAAINEIGNSGFSESQSVLTLPTTPTFASLEAALSDLTSTQVYLDWEVTEGVLDGYYIDVSKDPTFEDESMVHEDFAGKQIEVSQRQEILNLEPGTRYYTRLQSFNESGVSPFSQTVPFLTKPATVPYPEEDVTEITQISATVNWEPIEGVVDNYRISVSTLDDGFVDDSQFLSSYSRRNVPVDRTSILVNGLDPGTSYFAVVSAVNASGESEQPEKITILTAPSSPVFDLESAIISISQTDVAFTWESPSGLYDGYELEVSVDPSFVNTNLMLDGYGRNGNPFGLSQGEQSTTVEGLTPGQKYYARIRAFNGDNNDSPNSNVLEFTTVPKAPTLASVKNISQTEASLNWQSITGADVYLIDLNESAQFHSDSSVFDNFPLAVPFIVLDELKPGTQYYARVQSSNGSGNSGEMTPADYGQSSFITIPATPNLNSIEYGQREVTISWPEIQGASAYQVDASENFFLSFLSGFENLSTANPQVDVTGLDPGSEYQVRVRAVNESGESPNAQIVDLLTLPATPTARDATNSSSRVFTANFDPVSGAVDYYILEVSTDDFQTLFFQEQLTNSNPVKIENLVAGQTYQYRVKSGNASGESEYSNEVTVVAQNTASALSIASLDFNDEFGETSTSATVNVKFSGGVGDPIVLIRHKEILSETWSDYIEMDALSQTEFEFTILSNMLDEIGVVFEILADDAVTLVESKDNTIKRVFTESSSEPLPDIELGEWTMVSIPYILDDNLVTSIFNELGDLTYKKRWRLMTYIDGDYQDQGVGFTRIELGKGYWFNSLNDVKISVGAGQTNSVVPFNMPLQKGWNQIGNPYNVTINWDDVLDANNLPTNVSRLLVYNAVEKEFQESSSLEAFGGAFVFADEAIDEFLVSPTAGSINGRMSTATQTSNFDGADWKKVIQLNWGGTSREIAAVGMHHAANDSKDRFDKLVVPRFENYLEMYTSDNDYFYSKFSHDIKPPSEEQVWVFDLESNTMSGLADLSWDPSLVNGQGKLWLVDEENGKVIEMSSESRYSFGMNGGSLFSIHYSEDPNYVVIPTRLNLGDLYPNPVNTNAFIPLLLPKNENGYDLQINLFDLNGQLVKVIAEGMYNPGIHLFELDIESGSTIKDGVYFYSVSFQGQHSSQQKKIIIKR